MTFGSSSKTDFLAVMSHEVRTPITSINGFVDLLTATGTLTRQQRRYVDLVKTANEALLTVVNDILDFSKVEAGQLELESHPFSPTSLIHDVVGIVQPNASAKNLRLEYTIDRGVPEWLNGDRARLRQVLLNLLNNAIKFSEKGTIKIYLCEQASSDGRRRLQFTVKDEGVGIPPEHQHRLFKTFSQADSSVTRRHGGTGLGLAICKRLVALMDGEIEIVSQTGSGTAVSFTADLPPGSQPLPREDQGPPFENIDTIKARILIVDDIDTNREIAHAFLTDKGYRVDTAGNASDAIRMIRSEQYDLVLMDIQMPEMDGVTATKLIRALPDQVKDIPIIAMTANVLPRQVRSFLDAGMDDFVGKPIERGKLYKKVMHWSQTKSDRETSPARKSSHFSEMKYDQFIRIIGAPKAEPAAAQFLELLTAAFKSTPQVSRREAHDLINVAGLFGFDGLVDACRAINQLSPEQADLESALLDEVKRAQSMAQQTLIGHVLPNLRGALLRPAR